MGEILRIAAARQEPRYEWAAKHLPARYREARLKNATGPAGDACARYVVAFTPDTQRGLYLYGPTGAGKTWLAAAVVAEIAERGVAHPSWLPAMEIARALRDDVHRDPGERGLPMKAKLREYRLPVIDDLGTERWTDYVAEEMAAALCYRYDHCLPVIITSNYSLGELDERMGARIASRLAEMCQVVQVAGPDRRLAGALAGGGR